MQGRFDFTYFSSANRTLGFLRIIAGREATVENNRWRDVMSTSKQTLKQKAYREFKEYLVITLYLWVVFGLFVLYKSVILHEEHIDFVAKGLALINALALGKVILIAKALHLGEWADDAPLIYPTLMKSALFALVLAIFKILEEAAIGLYHKNSFQQSIADLGGGTLWGILTLTVLLFVMLIPFFGVGELQRVLGEGKLGQLFFRRNNLIEVRKEEVLSPGHS
jgi:hypothetical protein